MDGEFIEKELGGLRVTGTRGPMLRRGGVWGVLGREREGGIKRTWDMEGETKRIEEDEEGVKKVSRVSREGREREDGEARGGGAG
jgi:hypothetical protein